MEVHLYTLCWNEVDILPFFFDHYDPWVDRYFIYDDGSTDGSLDILNAHSKVNLRKFERTVDNSFVLSHQSFQNNAWKESRNNADWVIVTALDEFLHVKGWDNKAYLNQCKKSGITLIPALGFQMISDAFPTGTKNLLHACPLGASYNLMNKLGIFDPNAITQINFHVGRHAAAPEGALKFPKRDELMLHHYKYLGFNRTHRRHQDLAARLGDFDNQNQLGHHYHWSENQFSESWDDFRQRAVDVSSIEFIPSLAHRKQDIWWRNGKFKMTWYSKLLSEFRRF